MNESTDIHIIYLYLFQARGKSGPLFTFDVHDDIRVMHDASVETEESHAGKVLLRYNFSIFSIFIIN